MSNWGLSFWMLVPNDKEAYFNLQGAVPIGSGEWAVGNIFFNQDLLTPGEGQIDGAHDGAHFFDYPQGEWFKVIKLGMFIIILQLQKFNL